MERNNPTGPPPTIMTGVVVVVVLRFGVCIFRVVTAASNSLVRSNASRFDVEE